MSLVNYVILIMNIIRQYSIGLQQAIVDLLDFRKYSNIPIFQPKLTDSCQMSSEVNFKPNISKKSVIDSKNFNIIIRMIIS